MVIRAEEEARVFADPSVRAVMVGVAGEAAILDARLGNRCGGGAMAAIQKSALRFFEDFGYRGIGLSCRLENGVCHMRGIEGMDRGERYAIVAGGGIPALTVMGHNRRVDWPELIARIKAAAQSSGAVVSR